MDMLREALIREEDSVAHVYPDSMGYLTIGVGHLVDKRKGGGLPQHIIELLLDSDIENVEALLDVHLPWWRKQPDLVQCALQQMCFQLGIHGLKDFVNMLTAIQAGDYDKASIEALDSKWAREETPERARRVIALFTEKE